jgi:uncharacterized protein (DUF1501 family)
LRPQLAFAADGVAAHTLVLVLLEGGLDGVSALVPVGDDAYGRVRSSTLIPDGRAIGVDDMFALHPSLAGVADLWAEGLVAAVPAVGTPTRSRSHFAEMAVVAEGTGGATRDGTGWLARHLLTRSGGVPVILQGVSCGQGPALELVGHDGAFHVPDLAGAGIGGWDPADLPTVSQALAAAYSSARPQLADPASTAFEALERLRAAQAVTSTSSYDTDPWSAQLRQVSQIIRAGVGMEAAVVGFGGFDTHSAQGGADGQLAALLARLAGALAAFASDLHDRLDTITMVVMSEFGRRMAENGSGGTDHGSGGLSLVLGGGIRGGVHGAWPGLADDALDDGALMVATDTRSVLTEVVHGRLGNSSVDLVFPDFTAVPVGFA